MEDYGKSILTPLRHGACKIFDSLEKGEDPKGKEVYRFMEALNSDDVSAYFNSFGKVCQGMRIISSKEEWQERWQWTIFNRKITLGCLLKYVSTLERFRTKELMEKMKESLDSLIKDFDFMRVYEEEINRAYQNQ